jgi:nucleotide sugar dehydrogenase
MIKEKNISISLITGKKYQIIDNLNDKVKINDFVDKHKGKSVIVVQGLGFVGAVMSLVCANAPNEEYAVIGIDLDNEASYWKILSINEGTFPIISSDSKVDELYQNSKLKGNLMATYDPYAYSKANIIIIDINLDVNKNSDKEKNLIGYDVNLSEFKKAIKTIGKNCKEDVLILVETTVPPGTTKKIVKPIIKKELEKRELKTDKFKLGHSYERVMPGPNYIDSIQNFYRVYAGINTISADAIEKFLRTIISTKEYPLTRLGNTNATEMAKVLENSFRAMNIAFIVEWSRFAEEAGVNLYEVVNAIRMRPTHKNIMLPGIGVGGYCLTKDPLLASWSKQNLFDSNFGLEQSETCVKINDKMPQYAYNFLKENYKGSLSGKRILLLGVSYLNDVGDTRYTPVELLYNLLIKDDCVISLHDPYVSYWAEKDIEVETNVTILFEKNLDIIILSTGHSQYRNNSKLIQMIINQNDLFILDTMSVFNKDELESLKKKHTIKVVGRGDI